MMNQGNTSFSERLDRICRQIAPVWPLDSFVAVNPYFGLVDRSFDEVGALLAHSTGEHLFMPRSYYAEVVAQGRITEQDLVQAAERLALPPDPQRLMRALKEPPPPDHPFPLLVAACHREGAPPVSHFVLNQISGFLGSYYDRGQAQWQLPIHEEGPYTTWRRYTLIDRSARVAGLGDIKTTLLSAPLTAEAACHWAIEQLRLPEAWLDDYLFATLKSIGGWASYTRYLQMQAEVNGGHREEPRELLAIRLVWDALLHANQSPETRQQWRQHIEHWVAEPPNREQIQIDTWLLHAAEIAFRRQHLPAFNATPPKPQRPEVQAAFCIDVRSEVYRRHFEASLPGAQTLGIGGFFTLPIDYCRLGDTQPRLQMPVPLPTKVRAEEQGDAALGAARQRRLGRLVDWKQFKYAAASCFTFVESAGLSYVPRLLADTLGWHRSALSPDEAGLNEQERAQLKPRLMHCDGEPLPLVQRIDLAENMLRVMALTENFARAVLIVGHGSSMTNNPHRAGYDCGACAGQSGEVNARISADLANDPAVRDGLRARGIDIPADTVFVAALHDTTLDDLRLIDIPAALDPALRTRIETAAKQAGALTRLERLVGLDTGIVLGTDAPEQRRRLNAHVRQRGRDWSEVRPEWGLAGNAAFIAAPRWRTEGMNLAGRAFLHDYDPAHDPDYRVLTTIMTAPLVVANWINLQYYGSVVDNLRQGCGNKVLHNVVGGVVGVLEGNGGDLRVGLPWQALHDGSHWRHEPLRLSVYLEAPAEAIDRIIDAHALLAQFFDNDWMTLFCIEADGRTRRRNARGHWLLAAN